jgi:hypothetical protein
MNLKGNATGFFHVEKIYGVWWIVDPDGNAFISKGVDHVSYDGDYAPTLGYSPYNRAASKKYGGLDGWAKLTVERLRGYGFNTLGAWSTEDAFTKGMSYTIMLDIASAAGSEWLSGNVTDYFSGHFEGAADEQARRLCLPRKDDPYLVGYFTDNELRWSPDWRSDKHLFDDYLKLPPEAPGKRALVAYLADKYAGIDALNKAWNASLNSFDELLSVYSLSGGGALDADRLGFLEVVSTRYSEVCHDAIRRYDPNHLILGCRYGIRPPDEALKGCVGYVDVISINNYGEKPPLEELRRIHSLTDLPILIGEFSFKAMDSGLPNTKGAGDPLPAQVDRADHYQRYVSELISEPYVVGYHWFEYVDEPVQGRFDGENSNYGLVDIGDEPWTILVTRMTAVNAQAELMHLEGRDKAVVFYVSPDGDDRWSGRLPSASPSRTDGPFATITRARDAIRELRASRGEIVRLIMVFLRGGTYFLDGPLSFTAEDSGTGTTRIAYASYPGEVPVISGGRRISGWWQVTVGGRELWAADIPEVREGNWYFRELWVNGQRRFRVRHPEKGYLGVVDLPDVTPETQWTEGQRRFRFREGDLRAWGTADDAEVVVMNRWVESRLPIESVDEANGIVTFGKRSVYRLDPGDLYYVENALELLDSPGEWYLDRKAGILYYLPMPGEDMDKADVIAPALPQLLRFEGDPGTGRLISNVTVRGLTFSYVEWSLPPDLFGFGQAAIGVPASVYCEGVDHCVFEFCDFAHMGTYGVELSRGCHDDSIVGCEFYDLGAGGIKVGEREIRGDEAEQTHDNVISDCDIHDGGLIFHSAIGIWIGQSYDNRIEYNEIHDLYYTGISVGWTWGYGPSLARGNAIEHNAIHNIGIRSDGDGPILSDMGGIYTLGVRPDTIIRYNVFHDIAGFRYGGWGIYFDEGSTQAVAEYNIVYNTTHGGFHQHYGRENIVRNNIFAFGRDAQIQRSRAEDHLSFTFEHNIVYWRVGELLAGRFDDLNYSFDGNLYWREGGGEVSFGGLSLSEWHAKGMDLHSLIADPLFVNPVGGDFALKPDSPALSLGIKPVDLTDAGPRSSVLAENGQAPRSTSP